ncbi:MAG TPA: ATP-binding cassette domain-containing protein, partial [Aciduliprofundum sp.]|nr:ATP-binding cassette domain-containing protein [Aciduliprofundum sp.]
MLEVRGLAVEVDGRRVVERADLTVERGRISVLMGPNGSGKTSLLRAIAGIPGYRIAGGRIIMDGEDITELPPWERARRGLAIAHQHPPELEVRLRDLLTELSKRYGSRIGEICPELGIDHLLDRKAFSG